MMIKPSLIESKLITTYPQSRLLKLVHYMGGSVKNEIRENVTHLLAYSSTGEKYQYATTFNIPVMGEDWVHTAWAHRDEVGARADTDSMVCSCVISFIVCKSMFSNSFPSVGHFISFY